MNVENSRPPSFRELADTGRTYALDLTSSLILLVGACLMAGRVWRFPFDDEAWTLAVFERSDSALDLMRFFLNGADIHPPLSYLLYFGLYKMGWSEAAMRLYSLGMTVTALLLFQLLTLALIGQRTGVAVRPATRLIAVLVFGLCPLAIGQGDAIRYYPPFTLLFALFMVLYLAADNRVSRLGSAVALGLATSTNFIVGIVIIPFLVYRYRLERQFRPGFEVVYWLIFSCFASFGLFTAYSIVKLHLRRSVTTQFESGVLRAVATDVLGFFGGDAVGVTQSWIVLPVASIAAMALIREIDRKNPANPAHLLLLMLGATALVVLPGFATPRAFLYLAPVLAGVLTLFLDRVVARSAGRAVLFASLVLIAPVDAIANIDRGTRPFKRNAVIPFEEILDFIHTNEAGRTLIVSSDPILIWVLRHENGPPDRCVSYFTAEAACFAPGRLFDSVFMVLGHSERSGRAAAMERFQAKVNEAVAGKTRVATLHAGLDEDAAIKSRLAGVKLDEFILTVDLYR